MRRGCQCCSCWKAPELLLKGHLSLWTVLLDMGLTGPRALADVFQNDFSSMHRQGAQPRTVRAKLRRAINYHSPESLGTSLVCRWLKSMEQRQSVPMPNSRKARGKRLNEGRRPYCPYKWAKWSTWRLSIHVEQPLALSSWSVAQPRPLAWSPPSPLLRWPLIITWITHISSAFSAEKEELS